MAKSNEEKEHIVETFEDLFSEVCWAFDHNYPCELYVDTNGMKRFNVYKLTICEEGWYEYKGHTTKFNPKLWPKLELLAKVITDDPTISLFYKNE